MKIIDHKLWLNGRAQAPYVPSPNFSEGFDPRYIVLHYTVVLGGPEAIQWFADPEKQVSAHFVIDRNGSITQMVDLDKKAWHCGQSKWKKREGLNDCAIGIELVCAGKLESKEGKYYTWFGEEIAPEAVVWAQHAAESSPAPWHRFTLQQIATAEALCRALQAAYPIQEVLGHDQIAPGRKVDPGPAFPMDMLRKRLSIRI